MGTSFCAIHTPAVGRNTLGGAGNAGSRSCRAYGFLDAFDRLAIPFDHVLDAPFRQLVGQFYPEPDEGAAMESVFSSLKIKRIARKTYCTRNQANQDVRDYIERFYNPTRRHSTLGYVSPIEFEKQAQVA